MIDTLVTLIGKGVASAIDHGIEAAQNLQLDTAVLMEKVQLTLTAEAARVGRLLQERRAARAAADAKIVAAGPTAG